MPKFIVCVTQKVERIGEFVIEAESEEAAIKCLQGFNGAAFEDAVNSGVAEPETRPEHQPEKWDEGDWCEEAGAYALLDEKRELLRDLEMYG